MSARYSSNKKGVVRKKENCHPEHAAMAMASHMQVS